jgi:hypothetical protein
LKVIISEKRADCEGQWEAGENAKPLKLIAYRKREPRRPRTFAVSF